MSYKMLLNILILFLCTSCCACGDQCLGSTKIFYLRPLNKVTGENILIEYDTLTGYLYLTDEFDNRVISQVHQVDVEFPYLAIEADKNGNAEGKVFKLWIKNTYIGSFILSTKKYKENITSCCSSYKVTDLKFIEPNIILTKKPQEEKQPFYEVQF